MFKIVILSFSILFTLGCGNPLGGGSGTHIDPGHAPGVTLEHSTTSALGFEFNPLSHNYLVTSGGRFKVNAVLNTTNRPAVVSSSGRYLVYSTVQGQLLSDDGNR